MVSSSHCRSIAQTFVEARHLGQVVRPYPGPLPRSLAEGYDIQDYAIAIEPQRIGGWKVGRISDELVEQFGANRLAGPIFAGMIREVTAARPPEVPLLPGFAAVEAELMMRIGGDIPPGTGLDEIAARIDDVRFGLEIASSPFPQINAHGPAVTVSDFGNNFGLLLGPRIPDWRSRDLLGAPVALSIDGIEVGAGSAATMLDGPFGAVAFLARLLASRGIPLAVGTWVSTGAITGIHPVSAGQSVRASFDNEFKIACTAAAFAPSVKVNGSA